MAAFESFLRLNEQKPRVGSEAGSVLFEGGEVGCVRLNMKDT